MREENERAWFDSVGWVVVVVAVMRVRAPCVGWVGSVMWGARMEMWVATACLRVWCVLELQEAIGDTRTRTGLCIHV